MKKIVLITLVFFTLFYSCKKKSTNASENPVPSVPVNLTVYPNDPLNFKLQAIGGWIYINGGINGIILYHKSPQEFIAIERTSSYLPDNPSAKVVVMSDNFTCRDTISDSRWQIIDGTVTKGPAQWGLRLYGTTFDGKVLKIKK